MTEKKRVVITGSGIASPLGNDVETYCQNLYQGQYAIGPITTFDTANHKTKLGACLEPLPIPECLTALELKMCSNLSLISVFCAEQAINQAGLHWAEIDQEQIGVIVGSGFINLYDLENFYDRFLHQNLPISPTALPINMPVSPASQIAIKFGLMGVVKCVSTACASGFTALVDSVQLIQDGYQTMMIAGGSDLVMCSSLVHAWERMRVLSGEREDPALACRPFDQDRKGIALGDGAAFFVLESYEHAVARGATILAEIGGSFQNSDSVNLVKPQTKGEIACMEKTLQQANLAPEEIDVIYAHATGTRLNDITEYQSLHTVFQEPLKTIPVCGLKAMLGHTMGASGPMSLIAALGSFQSGYVYPIPNLAQMEEGIDLYITTAGQTMADINHILLNAFAFGGTNVCLLLSKSK